MSLELAAQHLASRGRKGDSMLVHMAPEEVSGLQALAKAAGGTLTLNPDTGLPEANFLKRMLPMIIGAGLSVASGGTLTPMIAGISNPALIGLGIGGLETARTGNLGKGLMAGLGAYGGAGLVGGLTAAAGTAGAAGAGAGAGTAAIDTTMASALPVSSGAVAPAAGLGGQTFAQASQAANAAAANQAVNTAMTGAMPLSSNAGLAGSTFGMSAAPMTVTPPPSFAGMGRGLGALSEQAGRDAFMSNVGGGAGLAKIGGAAVAPMMFQEPEAMQKPYTGSVLDYDYEYDVTNRTNPFRKVPRRAADGGMMASGPLEEMSARNEYETLMSNNGQRFAAGGPSHLGDYSDGGRLLKGPGDGVSDSIPATIANKRPARLADGEFVVPARIVSELGNGSTEAGARKLYAMMDRVQKARGKTTGKDRVAVNSRAEKLLPA